MKKKISYAVYVHCPFYLVDYKSTEIYAAKILLDPQRVNKNVAVIPESKFIPSN